MGWILGLSVVLASVAIWWSEIRPMFQWVEGTPWRVWRDTTMHGKPWWKVHVWPHIVGGMFWMGVLHLPGVAAPETVWGKLAAVTLLQTAWELAQIVTWSPNPRMAKWAVLWAPVEAPDQMPQIFVHAGLGALWVIWHPIMLFPAVAGLLTGVILLHGVHTRVQHENWRGSGPFPWLTALSYGMAWAGLGAAGALALLGYFR